MIQIFRTRTDVPDVPPEKIWEGTADQFIESLTPDDRDSILNAVADAMENNPELANIVANELGEEAIQNLMDAINDE